MQKRKSKGKIDLATKGAQRRFCLGLQRDAKVRPRAGSAYAQYGSWGKANGPACQGIPHRNREPDSEKGAKIISGRVH